MPQTVGFAQTRLTRKLGRVLTVGYGGTAFRLKDTKGLGYLALLGVGEYADPLARGFERIGAPL